MKRKLLRISEVAAILDVREEQAYKMARDGILPVVRVGRQVRIDEQRLNEWIASGGQALPGGWRKEPMAQAN